MENFKTAFKADHTQSARVDNRLQILPRSPCLSGSLSPCGLFMGPSILACVYFWFNPDTFLATRSCQSQAAAIAGQIAGCALAKQTENCIFYEYRTLAHVIHSPHTHIHTRAHTRGHRWQIKYVNLQWEMRKKMANSNCKS